MNEIRDFIDKISKMNNTDWAFFSSKLKKVKYSKNTKILELGKIERHLYFITKGIIRLYIPKEDADITFGFLFENEFVTGYDSLFNRNAISI